MAVTVVPLPTLVLVLVLVLAVEALGIVTTVADAPRRCCWETALTGTSSIPLHFLTCPVAPLWM